MRSLVLKHAGAVTAIVPCTLHMPGTSQVGMCVSARAELVKRGALWTGRLESHLTALALEGTSSASLMPSGLHIECGEDACRRQGDWVSTVDVQKGARRVHEGCTVEVTLFIPKRCAHAVNGRNCQNAHLISKVS